MYVCIQSLCMTTWKCNMYNYITNFIPRKIPCSVCVQIHRTCNLNNVTSVTEHGLAFWQWKCTQRTVAWESTVLYRSDVSFRSANGKIKDIPIKMWNSGCKVTEKHNQGTIIYCTVEDNESIFKCIFICDEFAKSFYVFKNYMHWRVSTQNKSI
jgi:hypothetical protein